MLCIKIITEINVKHFTRVKILSFSVFNLRYFIYHMIQLLLPFILLKFKNFSRKLFRLFENLFQ